MEVVLDIETNDLNATRVHCIVAKELSTGVIHTWQEEECYTKFSEWSKTVDKFYGHNIICFDAPVLNRLVGTDIQLDRLEDTLVMSQLLNPVRDGGHSLESWGFRLGFPKINFSDFSRFSKEMLEYCTKDVELTHRIITILRAELAKISRNSLELEYKVRSLINQQEQNGFKLDTRKAMLLVAKLKDKSNEIETRVTETFQPLPTFVKEVIPRYKKDGTLSPVGLRHFDDLSIVGGVHSVLDYPVFNLASRQQIIKQLMLRGWKPEKFTEKGQAIVDETVLMEVDIPEAKMIAEYLLLGKRIAQVESWLEEQKEDEKVHGRVFTLGTVSTRMSHSSPNMAQVPASYSPYGRECRECWTASNSDYSLVGCDASSLELRVLAHYLGDENFTREVVEGDVHTANQKAAGLETRDQAKTFIYAFIYGAGPVKIGKIVGGNVNDGKRLIDKFLSNMPKLADLRRRVDIASERGYLIGLDGRRLVVRKHHAAMNLLIQGAGAIICKQWLVDIDKLNIETKLNAKLVASIHDEYQFEVPTVNASAFGEETKKAIKTTEQVLKLRCPLGSEYKIGKTWAETH